MSILDDTVPADGDGVTTGVKVSELAGHIRTLKTDINENFATIDFVNASLAAATLNLFLTDTASSEVSGYYEMLFTETGASGSSLTANSVSDGDLLWSFISPQFDGADQLSAGLYVISLWAEQDSNKTVTLTAKLYKRDSGGTETLLLETSTSDEIPKDTKTQIIMSGFLENDEAISSTDRVVLKIYANVSGGGGAPNITIYMEGTDDSRIAVRIPTSVITSKIFNADGDTYVEVTDDDVIHFATTGSERVTIDKDGKVGIKTPTPTHALTINDLNAIRIGNGNKGGFIVGFDGDGGDIQLRSNIDQAENLIDNTKPSLVLRVSGRFDDVGIFRAQAGSTTFTNIMTVYGSSGNVWIKGKLTQAGCPANIKQVWKELLVKETEKPIPEHDENGDVIIPEHIRKDEKAMKEFVDKHYHNTGEMVMALAHGILEIEDKLTNLQEEINDIRQSTTKESIN